MSALDKELAFFDAHRDEYLLIYGGQYVLIKDDALHGAFTTQAQAYEAGLKKFGNQPFLTKQVTRSEPTANYLALQFGLLRSA